MMARFSPASMLIATALAAACIGFCRGEEFDGPVSSGNSEPLPGRIGAVVGTPHRPMAASRPATWPGIQTQYTAAQPAGKIFGPPSAATSEPQSPEPSPAARVGVPSTPAGVTPFEPGQTIARVGSEIILASEIPGIASLSHFAEQLAKRSDLSPAQKDQARQQLAGQWDKVRVQLNSMIESKLLLSDLLRNVPAENVAKMREGIGQRFEEDALPSILKENELQTRAELEAKLRLAGSSIEEAKRNFVESQMSRGWLHENVKARGIVTHQQLLEYYQNHPEEFRIEGRARWEQLTMRKSQFSSKDDAYMAVAALGNEVLGGRGFADVAKARSQGVTASSGGAHNWTTQGSLISKPLDEAIFALPVGSLSQIIEDDTGFHIVRVSEREDARQIPFSEAQSQIREKIKKQEEQQLIADFKQRVRERTPIWTVFDNPDELQQLSKLPSDVFRR